MHVDEPRPDLGGLQVATRTRSMPSPLASSGSSVSSSRRSPRSLPYDVEFSLTSTTSRTPWLGEPLAPRRGASGGRRETNEPRKAGIAQNEHRRSHPTASFSGATPRRTAAAYDARSRRRAPMPGAGRRSDLGMPGGTTRRRLRRRARPAAACAGPAARAAVRFRQRRSSSRVGDVGVVVEAEHGVGLGQRARRARCRSARPGSRRRPRLGPSALSRPRRAARRSSPSWPPRRSRRC